LESYFNIFFILESKEIINSSLVKNLETSLQTAIAENKQNNTMMKKFEEKIAKQEQIVSLMSLFDF